MAAELSHTASLSLLTPQQNPQCSELDVQWREACHQQVKLKLQQQLLLLLLPLLLLPLLLLPRCPGTA